MSSNRGNHSSNAGPGGAVGHCRVRWTLREIICVPWRKFCSDNELPVQAEVENALSWWMELPASMRDRLRR